MWNVCDVECKRVRLVSRWKIPRGRARVHACICVIPCFSVALARVARTLDERLFISEEIQDSTKIKFHSAMGSLCPILLMYSTRDGGMWNCFYSILRLSMWWNNVHKFYGKSCENFQKFYLQAFIRLDRQLSIMILKHILKMMVWWFCPRLFKKYNLTHIYIDNSIFQNMFAIL